MDSRGSQVGASSEFIEQRSTHTSILHNRSDENRNSSSPFRRVHFDLGQTVPEGNDTNNVSTQTDVVAENRRELQEITRPRYKHNDWFTRFKSIMEYLSFLEDSPKTRFTYAKSIAYDLRGERNPEMPNMSRYGLDYYANGEKRTDDSFYGITRRSVISDAQPEPVGIVRQGMAKIVREITKTVTKTSMSSSTTGASSLSQESVAGRMTPESKSGNERSEVLNYSLASTVPADWDEYSTTRWRSTKKNLSGRFSSAAKDTNRSLLRTVLRTVTTKHMYNSMFPEESSAFASSDTLRERRSPWWLLLLLPLLIWPLWSSRSVLVDKSSSVANSLHGLFVPPVFLASLAGYFSPKNDSSGNYAQDVPPAFPNAPSPPIPKSCCDDIELIKSQVALILANLEKLNHRAAIQDERLKDHDTASKSAFESITELRTLLIRLETAAGNQESSVKTSSREGLSVDEVRHLVTAMIRKYDEDKVGEPDHALESAGASVVSTRCTEEYKWGFAQYSLFGIPIWSWTTSPRLAIQDGVKPGQCWAFKGGQGYLLIRLAGLVRPTSFSIEHLSKNLSPTGTIDSAPKDFEVLGLVSEQGPAFSLGVYRYEDNDQPLQNFPVQLKLDADQSFPFVELRITSNHGNPDYTCLYRFRVHGQLVKRGY